MENSERYLKGLLALQLRALPELEKPEILLSQIGFTAGEIADLMGKTKAAVQKSITRARGAKKGRKR